MKPGMYGIIGRLTLVPSGASVCVYVRLQREREREQRQQQQQKQQQQQQQQQQQAYSHYDVQLVISPGAQFSDARDERELLFLCLYMCMRMRFC